MTTPPDPETQEEMARWAEFTPDETSYRLDMHDGQDYVQELDLSREEYIGLKAHLAQLRGYTPATAEVAHA